MKRLAVFLLFVACFAPRAVAFGFAPSAASRQPDAPPVFVSSSVKFDADFAGRWPDGSAETAANLVTLGGYGGFKEGLADNSAYEGPLGGLKAYGRGVRNFVTFGYYDPIANAKEGEGAAAALQHTKDITGWTKYEQFGTHLGEGEYLEATGDLLVGMGQTAGTILAGKGAITVGKGLLTKTEAGVESVTAPSKLTNREYIPEDVTESVAAKRMQPANAVNTPKPQLALPEPEPQLALPAPEPQLALPAPEPQLALPEPKPMLALPTASAGPRQTTILGENMQDRVKPFADATGARTLPFGTSRTKWASMTPRERWELNDSALRMRIREGDSFRYIGRDPFRRPELRSKFDLTGSELLRLKDRGVPYEIVKASDVGAALGHK